MVVGEYGDNPLLILLIVLLLSALILNYIIGWSKPKTKARKSRMEGGNHDDRIIARGDLSPQARGFSSIKKRERRKCDVDSGELLEEDDYLAEEDFGMDGLNINSPPRGDGPSMSHYHNKGPTSESQALIDRYFDKVNFNMTSEDLDQPWFHRCATREIAEELLRGGNRGAFLVRPSSRRGSYAMSWMKDVQTGEIGHSLIYGLFPGFSLKQSPDLKERFWSIQSLIEHCTYLTKPVICADYLGTKGSLGNNYSKTSSEVIGRMVEKLGVNDASLVDVRWSICILGEGPETYNSSRCEKRTYVRYCEEEYAAPELLPLSGNGLNLVAEAAYKNTALRSLAITGHEGYLRMNFKPILGDEEAKALSKLLELNKSITSLNLSVNNITDVGAKAIAKSLQFNRTLRRLNLSQNFITSPGLTELSNLLRTNSALEELDIRNQLYRSPMSGGCVTLACGDKEKVLIAMIGDTMKRRVELLGGLLSVGSSLSSSNGASQQKVAPLSVIHGFLSRKKAELRLAEQSAGSFMLYLNKYIPNVVFIAAVVEDANESGKKTIHRRILRTRQGYIFSGSEKTNGYVSPRQTVPTLFDHCAWYISSKQELVEAADEYLIADDIRARLRDSQLLLGLWGMKESTNPNTVHNTTHHNGFSNHPLYNNHNSHSNNHHHHHHHNGHTHTHTHSHNNHNDNNHSNDKHKQGNDVYPTLTYLVHRNKAWLRKPIHAPQDHKPPDEGTI